MSEHPHHASVCRSVWRLPPELDQVVFNNLEAVPESLEVMNCFEEVSLFKVHQTPSSHLICRGFTAMFCCISLLPLSPKENVKKQLGNVRKNFGMSFEMSPRNFLNESASERPHGERYLEKLQRWRQRQIAKGSDPEDVRSNRSFDMAILPVRRAL